jgi:hypothetical protein
MAEYFGCIAIAIRLCREFFKKIKACFGSYSDVVELNWLTGLRTGSPA